MPFILEPHQTRCCTADGQLLELANIPEHCFPIILPADDPAHSSSNARCMNFVRTITDRDRNCVGGYQPAEQVSNAENERRNVQFKTLELSYCRPFSILSTQVLKLLLIIINIPNYRK